MKWSMMRARERDVLIAAIVAGRADGTDSERILSAWWEEEPPPYSRQMSAAWHVVEQLNDRMLPDGTRVTLASIDYARAAHAWHAAFQAALGSERAWTAGAWAATAADALCQAALLVLDYDLDELPEPQLTRVGSVAPLE
jgi:hypothetical protein